MEENGKSNNHNHDSIQYPPLAGALTSTFPNHRRAHSEVQFRLTEDQNLSETFGGFDELGSEDDILCSYMGIEKLGSGSDSVGSSAPRHGNSLSVDGSSTMESFEFEAKRVMPSDKLAELWVVDPKRAKRITANRQSAARSKERKNRYISELERKVQLLQIEASTLSAQVSLSQRNITGLSSEHTELKLRLQVKEQQAKLRDALNDQLIKEIERLKFATGEVLADDAYNIMQYPQQQQPPPYFQHGQEQIDAHENLQQMTHQFQISSPPHEFMHHAATSNALPQSPSFSEAMNEDPLSQLHELDTSCYGRGSNFGVSDSNKTM